MVSMVPKKKSNRRDVRKKDSKSKKKIVLFVRLGLLCVLVIILICFVVQVSGSRIVKSGGKFNFVVGSKSGEVMFGSYDSVEKQVISISFPQDLYIKSRSVGEYRVGRLYSLALYEDEPGEFLQRKVQGFLRVPVSGYILIGGEANIAERKTVMSGVWRGFLRRDYSTNMNFLDLLIMMHRSSSYVWFDKGVDDLVREGVYVERSVGGYGCVPSRTQEYVEGRFFDWNVAREGLSVAVINSSTEKGLASDVSDFVINIGADVVMVREGENKDDNSKLVVSKKELINSETVSKLQELLEIDIAEVGDTQPFRSDIVFYIGSDMVAIF